jgi:hypothetical protein
VSSPNPNAREGRKQNSATVPYLEYYYPKYSRDPRCNWDEQYLSNWITRYKRIQVEVTEGARNLCRRLGKKQFTPPTQATAKSRPNREQRQVSEHAGRRLNLSTASLLMIADDLV